MLKVTPEWVVLAPEGLREPSGYHGPRRQQSFLTENGAVSPCKGVLIKMFSKGLFSTKYLKQNKTKKKETTKNQTKEQVKINKQIKPSHFLNLDVSKSDNSKRSLWSYS